MYNWLCLQCGRQAVGDTTFIVLQRGSITTARRMRICYQCCEILETMLDSGTDRQARYRPSHQLRLPMALAG